MGITSKHTFPGSSSSELKKRLLSTEKRLGSVFHFEHFCFVHFPSRPLESPSCLKHYGTQPAPYLSSLALAVANQQINNQILTQTLIGFQTKYTKAFKDNSTWPSLQFGFDQSKSRAFCELKSNWKSNPLIFSLSSMSSLS